MSNGGVHERGSILSILKNQFLREYRTQNLLLLLHRNPFIDRRHVLKLMVK